MRAAAQEKPGRKLARLIACRLNFPRALNDGKVIQLKRAEAGDKEIEVKAGIDDRPKHPDGDWTDPLLAEDLRLLLLEPERVTEEDKDQVETTPLLAAILRCNSCVSPLTSSLMAKGATFYLTGETTRRNVNDTRSGHCACRLHFQSTHLLLLAHNKYIDFANLLIRLNTLEQDM